MSRREDLQPYFDRGAEFHGWLSPGLVIGIFMVDLAKEVLGPRELIDSVVETRACIPDAIQLMTKCTYGNGWMATRDWGKMALTLFDKKERDWVRVFVDLEKIKKYPLIHQWYMNKGEVDKDRISAELLDIGRDILSWQRVKVTHSKDKKGELKVCPSCGETYPGRDGELCKRCSGSSDYYELIN
jgi:formylmethanofuran dehydrogenase subunit E